MSLFNEAETEATENASEPTLDDIVSYRKKRFKGQREVLLKDLPRARRFCTLVGENRFCERCDSELHSIGEEFVRTEIEFIPAKVNVIDYYRETFECRSCRKQGEPYIEKAPIPYPVIQHSYASPSTVAWVIHQKYEMAIPLYRQEKEWLALGVKLSRATMSKWIMITHRDWLSPVIGLLHKKLLEEHYLHCDETPVQVLKEPGRKNTTDSYMWVYSTVKHSTQPIKFFEYQPGRGGKYPQAFLQDFKGYLHTDAYAGYNKVDDVTQCFCWSHVRRKFVDALPKKLESPEVTIPSKAIKFINKLFKIEQALENESAENLQKRTSRTVKT